MLKMGNKVTSLPYTMKKIKILHCPSSLHLLSSGSPFLARLALPFKLSSTLAVQIVRTFEQNRQRQLFSKSWSQGYLDSFCKIAWDTLFLWAATESLLIFSSQLGHEISRKQQPVSLGDLGSVSFTFLLKAMVTVENTQGDWFHIVFASLLHSG